MASSFVRNSVVNAAAGIFTTLGGFLSTIIVARLLGVQGTGIVAFATWAVTIAMIVSDLGLTGCLPRFLPELLAGGQVEQANRLAWRLLRSFLAYVSMVALCFALYAAWLFWHNLHPFAWSIAPESYETSPVFWTLIGLSMLVQTLANFANCWLKGQQDFNLLARVAAMTCLAQVAATAVGASLFGITGALAAMGLGALVPVALLVRLPPVRGPIDATLRRRVTRFSLETWGSYLLTAFFASRMEVFFLDRSWGSQAVGLFSVSLTLSNLATQGPLLLTGALLPRLSHHLGRNEQTETQDIYAASVRLMALVVFPACLGTAAIAPSLLPLMYGESFAPAVPTAVILLCGSAFAAITAVTGVYLIAVERTRFLLGTALVGAALSILAGLTIVPAFGSVAAACGRGGVQVTLFFGTIWYVQRQVGCPTPIVVLVKLFAAAALCAVVARLVVTEVPDVPGVVAAIAAGVVTYAAAIRIMRPLPRGDVEKLGTAVMILPRTLRPAARAGLQLIWS